MLVCLACSSPDLERAPESGRPNIVCILADDLGYGDLGCYSSESKIPTPNLDELAREGMRFTDAHCPSSVCSPTRYGILTGRYCWRSWLSSSVLWAWDPPLIQPDRPTVSAFLQQRGYATICVGKWHLGWDWPTVGREPRHGGPRTNVGIVVDFDRPIAGGPTARGFDAYFGDDVPNFPPYCYIENDRTVGTPSQAKPDSMFGTPGPMLPGWKLDQVMPDITARAVRAIDEHARAAEGQPFFLYFALTAPHTPIAPSERFVGQSQAGRYGDYVHQVDHTVGEVMAALDRNGLAANTLLVFTSDNGSPARNGANMSGPPGSVVRDFGHHPSGPWRGMKADIYEGGHRVPFIVRWPGQIEAGAVSEEIICHVDLFRTIAAILGEQPPAGSAEDSYDILPVLRGRELERPIREATVHHSSSGMFAIRQGRWKLILGLGSGGWTSPVRIEPEPGEAIGQLYDLASDPGESDNLYQEQPEIVARLAQLLDAYRRSGRSTPVESR